MTTITEELLRTLHSPKRNHYYYGKPLDVRSFELEQCYGIDKQWLLNRLTLGTGVLCGLRVVPGADGTVALQRGVAIDGLGREIIVPDPVVVDPAQPTDEHGRPTGDPLASGFTTIRVCYAECAAEPTAVEVSECDGCQRTAPALTRESFVVLVTAGLPDATPPALSPEQRDAIFPAPPPDGFDRRVAAESTLDIHCAPPEQPCVVVATVDLDASPRVVDEYGHRPQVFSNTVLFQLIAALAERVDACCGGEGPPPVELAPRVTGIRPGNAATVPDSWAQEPTLTLGFDQEMALTDLENPEDWLRVWWFPYWGPVDFGELQRIKVHLADPGGGMTPTYRAEPIPAERFTVVVQLSGDGPITAAATGLNLDAEFAGTALTSVLAEELWEIDNATPGTDLAQAIVTQGFGTLPSGNGQPGGAWFSSFFRLGPVQ